MIILKIPEDKVGEVEQFRAPLKTIMDKMDNLEKELSYLETQRIAAKANFWRKLEEIHPETEKGKWGWDNDKYALVKREPTSTELGFPSE